MAELTARIDALQAEVERLTRGAKRQAAPFSKGTRVAEPKPPGRTPGAGPFRYHEPPPSEAITTPPVDVKVTLDACPTCGGHLEEARVDLVYTTEIPGLPLPPVVHKSLASGFLRSLSLQQGWTCDVEIAPPLGEALHAAGKLGPREKGNRGRHVKNFGTKRG